MSDRTTIHCARCATDYTVGRRAFLPACPTCGRAPTALRSRARHNGLASTLAVVALAALGAGFTQPFITMDKLGHRESFSLVGGVRELFERGYPVIGGVLLVFSVIFPVAKLATLLLATSGLVAISARARRAMHRVADFTGKYSMLDVLVVAVIIVLVRFQNVAHVEAHAGTVWFTAAVLLSMASALCARLPEGGLKR